MDSIWTETAHFRRREKLKNDVYTPAVIIGAGITGILTSYFLKKNGIESIIIEKSLICSGQTKNTTAKITAQHADIYHKLLHSVGEEKAKIYYEYNSNAIDSFEKIISEENINCHFKRLPSFIYSLSNRKNIELECDAYDMLGIKHTFTTGTELPFEVSAALKMENQAQFSPLEFLEPLTREMTIFENTPALKVENNTVITDEARINAENVIFACNYPFVNFPGMYFLKMHRERSYVLALENTQELDGVYYCPDGNGTSLRNFSNVLLFGGQGHRTGKNEAGGRYKKLKKKAKDFWPDSKCVLNWSAQDCITGDGIPYIGRYASDRKNWYVATGYNKWGMTSSMTAAKIISESIASGKDKSTIFSPKRKFNAAVLGEIGKDTAQAVTSIAARAVLLSGENPTTLDDESGAVCSCSGKKEGVYKDDKGDIHTVSSKCPHLGCELHFNADDKIWECPCHGSCFSTDGKLIDGPAQIDIKKPQI